MIIVSDRSEVDAAFCFGEHVDDYNINYISKQGGNKDPLVPVILPFLIDYKEQVRVLGFGSQKNVDPYWTFGGDLYTKSRSERLIDLNRNMVSMGRDLMILNFTQETITVVESGELFNVYHPTDQSNVSINNPMILIVEVTNINKPQDSRCSGNRMYPYNDFIRKLSAMPPNRKVRKTLADYKMATEFHQYMINGGRTTNDNAYRIIRSLEITGHNLNALISGEDLFVEEFDLVMSTKSTVCIEAHPSTYNIGRVDSRLISAIGNNNLTMYIIDNDSIMNDRYTTLLGSAFKIPSLKDRSCENGLYIRHMVSGRLVMDEIIPLDKIDEQKNVFKTKEDAVYGADSETRAKDELRKEEHRMKTEEILLKKNDLDHRQANIELKLRADELKLEKEKLDKDRESLNDRTKHESDMLKIKMDLITTVLKTCMSLATVIIGFLTLYKKK